MKLHQILRFDGVFYFVVLIVDKGEKIVQFSGSIFIFFKNQFFRKYRTKKYTFTFKWNISIELIEAFEEFQTKIDTCPQLARIKGCLGFLTGGILSSVQKLRWNS